MATPTAQTITITPATTTYPIGAVVQIATLFATDGTPVDPSVVSFSYKPVAQGAQTVLVYGTDAALAKDSTGNYHVNLDTTAYGGVWNWRFFSTGTGQSSIDGTFYVRPNITSVTVTPPTTGIPNYTVTNASTNRTLNVQDTSVTQLANVLAQLLSDLGVAH